MSGNPNTLAEIAKAAGDAGFIGVGDQFAITPLSGGVSCEVFLLEVEKGPPVVVKRPLAKLHVAADWYASVARAESEVAWLTLIASLDSHLVPRVLAQDRERHLFFMEYLPEERFPVWKNELAAGRADPKFAASVGHHLSRIHAFTAHSPSLADRFSNQRQFNELRLDAYLLAAARANDDVAFLLRSLAESVETARIALMQGDVSPKNILCGPASPVFLDAETACYGDPAFDLAFCLNHLLLKSVWHPEHTRLYSQSFSALKDAYLAGVTWEAPELFEARASKLIGGLLLARIDGKSPVEYLSEPATKAFVRRQANTFLRDGASSLAEISDAWTRSVQRYFTVSGTR